MTPLVTVVIPARNEEGAIAAAIGAVLAQTYPRARLEVVIVDGNSDDRTVKVSTEALEGSGLHRWEVVTNPNGATPSNLNVGLAWAAGEILVRVDARSLIPPDYVARTVNVLADPDIAVTGGSQIALPRSGTMKDQAIARALNNRYAMGGSRYRRAGAASGRVDTVYLGVFRTAQLRSAGGWNEDFPTNQDFDLNRRMADRGHIWFEADLPVGYFGRQQLREIWQQYNRFGRWKVRYWRRTGDRPQPRQVAILVLPVVGGGFAAALLAKRPISSGLFIALGLTSTVVVDAVGGSREHIDPPTRVVAGATNIIVGLAWWSGVLVEWARPEVSEPTGHAVRELHTDMPEQVLRSKSA